MTFDLDSWRAGSTLTLSRSCSKVKVVGQRSQSQDGKCSFTAMDAQCNVTYFIHACYDVEYLSSFCAKVVGTTSSEALYLTLWFRDLLSFSALVTLSFR